MLAWRRPQAFAPSAVAAAVTAPARRAASWAGSLANPGGGALTEDGARALVLDWQRAKAAATGAAHERGALDAVLGGRMLQEWRQRAAELQEDGWHWEYDLREVALQGVAPAADGRGATVTARLREGARLVGADGAVLDAYRSNFGLEYVLARRAGAGWRIVASRVLPTEALLAA